MDRPRAERPGELDAFERPVGQPRRPLVGHVHQVEAPERVVGLRGALALIGLLVLVATQRHPTLYTAGATMPGSTSRDV